MQTRNSCRVIAHICKFAWFHIENETDRLIVTLQGDLTNFDQPIFDRVVDLPEDVRAAFLSKIDGTFAIEDAGEFDRIVRLADVVATGPGNASDYGYGSGNRYNGD